MKDYLVISSEGNVKILDIPNNVSKSDIIEIARRVICDTMYPVTQLNNIKTYKNYEIDDLEERYCKGYAPDNYTIVVYYEDYK